MSFLTLCVYQCECLSINVNSFQSGSWPVLLARSETAEVWVQACRIYPLVLFDPFLHRPLNLLVGQYFKDSSEVVVVTVATGQLHKTATNDFFYCFELLEKNPKLLHCSRNMKVKSYLVDLILYKKGIFSPRENSNFSI